VLITNLATAGSAAIQADEFYLWVSSGNADASLLPEIYYPGNAQEWYALSYYGARYKTGPIIFPGEMTECIGTAYKPPQGWTQLYTTLYADPLTSPGLAMQWSTDIRFDVPPPNPGTPPPSPTPNPNCD
ncbi:MAG: hypothetical protein ACYDBJ_28660, partial [Aggregatilineales bacterium]